MRKIYIDSRTCAGNPANFTARLPEPIRADPTPGIVLSQLTFANNFDTVVQGKVTVFILDSTSTIHPV